MNAWWTAIRPKTLLASIGPVLLATALASNYVTINVFIFFMTLACALCLQITVNLANDLFDGLSGVDNEYRVGPSRALHSGSISANGLKVGLIIAIALSILTGCYLVTIGGYGFLLLGALAIIAALAYSTGPYPLASNALGEVTVFIFFGLVSVLGSFYLQTNDLSPKSWIYACIVGILSSALMLVNNIRDIDSDQVANKITLAVKLGAEQAKKVYRFMLVIALAMHGIANLTNLLVLLFPLLICALLLPMLFIAINTYQGKEFNTLLANTAKFGFVYCVTTSLALLIS